LEEIQNFVKLAGKKPSVPEIDFYFQNVLQLIHMHCEILKFSHVL